MEKSRVQILGVPMDRVSMNEAVKRISEMITSGRPHQVITANPEILLSSTKDEELKKIIKEASLVTADGIGVVWAASFLGLPVPERVTGIDLAEQLLKTAAKKTWKVYLLGSAPGVVEMAKMKLEHRYPGLIIVGTFHGYFSSEEEKAILAEIKKTQPNLLFVGLGAPRQEKWIHKNRFSFPRELVAIGIGGSLDVFSGKIKRAPKWAIKWKIEWLYRLIKEPKRLKRQLQLPVFVWETIKQSVLACKYNA